MTPRNSREPLGGITVLELGSFITAPYAGLLLADLGAEVIKIESPDGDPFRSFGASKYSPNFVGYNRNKRSVVLDLKQPNGRKELIKLAKRADVLIENFRPGVLESLKIGYADLRKINRRLIFCSISGFNRTGPNRGRPAFDLIGQALSGLLGIMVDPAHPAVRGPTIADQLAGFYACYGILGALLSRMATNKGRHVDVNMIESTVSFMPDVFASLTRDHVVMGSETRAAYSQAYAFTCGDGSLIGLHLSSLEKFWVALIEAVDARHLLQDERFCTRMQRIKNYDNLREILAERFRARPRAEWLVRLKQADVPHAPIHRIDEVMQDPEVLHSGCFYELQHPEMGTVTCIHRPVLYDGARPRSRYAPPTLGEHTEEVLQGKEPKRAKRVGSRSKRNTGSKHQRARRAVV